MNYMDVEGLRVKGRRWLWGGKWSTVENGAKRTAKEKRNKKADIKGMAKHERMRGVDGEKSFAKFSERQLEEKEFFFSSFFSGKRKRWGTIIFFFFFFLLHPFLLSSSLALSESDKCHGCP